MIFVVVLFLFQFFLALRISLNEKLNDKKKSLNDFCQTISIIWLVILFPWQRLCELLYKLFLGPEETCLSGSFVIVNLICLAMDPRVLDSFQSISHKAIDWIWSNVITIVTKQKKGKNNNRNKWYIWKQLCQTPKYLVWTLKKAKVRTIKPDRMWNIWLLLPALLCIFLPLATLSMSGLKIHELLCIWTAEHGFFSGLLWFLFRICCQIDFGGFFSH